MSFVFEDTGNMSIQYIEQMVDITAFLQGDLKGDVYVEPPFVLQVPMNHVLNFRKALYGLKQTSNVWHNKLNNALQNYGMKSSEQIPCF